MKKDIYSKILMMILSLTMILGLFSGVEPVSAASKPAKPKITVKSVVNDSAIAITIGKTKNADGYAIYMKAPGEKKYSKIAKYNKSGIATRTYYADITKDGEYSFKVKAYSIGKNKNTYGKYSKAVSLTVNKEIKNLSDVITGDIVRFGAYEQDADFENGKEDVEWVVLSNTGDQLFLLSRYVLDVGNINAKTNDKITYENSGLRKWLNSTFLTGAFGEEETAVIADTLLEDVGVTDKVFLLSWDEAKNAEYGFGEKMDRRCATTEYSQTYLDHDGDGKKESIYTCEGYLANNVCRTYNGMDTCYWWLRSDNGGEEFKLIGERGGWTHTTYYGSKINTGHDDGDGDEIFYARDFGIRPAIKVDLNGETGKLVTVTRESTADIKTLYQLRGAADSDLNLDTDDITDISKAKQGDLIRFGSYEQDGTDADGTEPITWLVLSKTDTELFVVSKYVLDNKYYQDQANDADTTWENCSLRLWLNDEFYNGAFTDPEKEMIVTRKLKTPDYGSKDASVGTDTEDKIFLLSAEDVTNTGYGFKSKASKEDINRRSAASIAAGRRLPADPDDPEFDEYPTTDGYCSEIYWLRNRTTGSYGIACVWFEGILTYASPREVAGVRPAMVIKLK